VIDFIFPLYLKALFCELGFITNPEVHLILSIKSTAFKSDIGEIGVTNGACQTEGHFNHRAMLSQ
jgi:hypothetical protein